MTDNEIMKAVACCVGYRVICPNECPLLPCPGCSRKLRESALDLFNRQKAEIERLKAESEKHSDECLKCYAKGLYEGITEFAEKLKHLIGLVNGFDYDCNNVFTLIDNLAKEMGVVE